MSGLTIPLSEKFMYTLFKSEPKPPTDSSQNIPDEITSKLIEISKDRARWDELPSWVLTFNRESIVAIETQNTPVSFLLNGLLLDYMPFSAVSNKDVYGVRKDCIRSYLKALKSFGEESSSLKALTEYLFLNKIKSTGMFNTYFISSVSEEEIETAMNNEINGLKS